MILDGKVTAAALEKDIRERIDVLKERGCTLKLAVILAGSSKPSHMYAEFMKKAALSYGIGTELYEKPENVKEDELSLYGFITNEELRMFELLIGVSGVGAKSAITMLSAITPSKFALAVISNDVKTLTKVPGIGTKSAQRIILELKDKLKTEEAIQTNDVELTSNVVGNNNLEEADQALKVLGYTRQEIESVLAKIDINTLTVEDIIRKALSFLGM